MTRRASPSKRRRAKRASALAAAVDTAASVAQATKFQVKAEPIGDWPPSPEYIRWWILRNAWMLASVDLPVEAFIVEANVDILTSLLFLKKSPPEVIKQEAIGDQRDYPVFMEVAEKVGFDRRGNTLYKLSPEGEELTRDVEEIESIPVGGRRVVRTLRRKEKILDNDLPVIADRYRAFRSEHPEAGA